MNAWQAIAACLAGRRTHFRSALEHSRLVQRQRLAAILASNARSEFGRRHGFATLATPSAYRERVPLSDYGTCRAAIQHMLESGSPVLCAAPVIAVEQTSGSVAASKLIPYTAASIESFRRAILPWLDDLLCAWPGIRGGKMFWPVSPVGRESPYGPPGGGPGYADDAAYFGPVLGPLLHEVSAIPVELSDIRRMQAWRYLVLRFLLASENLSMISVWSPTFLICLAEGLLEQGPELVRDLRHGGISARLDPGLALANPGFTAAPEQAERLQAFLADPGRGLGSLWPRLQVISTWTHASAARWLPALQAYFPGVVIQGKGLLSTEAVVSVPLADLPYPVLAVDSDFYEFEEHGGRVLLPHELEVDGTYQVIVTTSGGLYRYRTGDTVRVRGMHKEAPLLEFAGRTGQCSDLCGEKLTDAFVQQCLPQAAGFAMLAPLNEARPGYALLLDAGSVDPAQAERLAGCTEQALDANPHYRYARRLGQLDALRPIRLRRPLARFARACESLGKKPGNLKLPALLLDQALIGAMCDRPGGAMDQRATPMAGAGP